VKVPLRTADTAACAEPPTRPRMYAITLPPSINVVVAVPPVINVVHSAGGVVCKSKHPRRPHSTISFICVLCPVSPHTSITHSYSHTQSHIHMVVGNSSFLQQDVVQRAIFFQGSFSVAAIIVAH
jgi:hypothetical protein